MSCHYVNCPYCDEEREIELDGQRANENYVETCDKCKKEFTYYYELSADFTCDKIPSQLEDDEVEK
jgi:transposase-like protein